VTTGYGLMNFKTIHDMEFESYTEKHAATSEMNCHKDVFFLKAKRLMDFLLLVVSSELDDIKLKSMLEGSPAALRLKHLVQMPFHHPLPRDETHKTQIFGGLQDQETFSHDSSITVTLTCKRQP
jgi:hypothetical protein